MRRMLLLSALPACSAASPPTPVPRLAHVPPPYGVAMVSPVSTRTLSNDTPTAVATTCASIVSVPCPCSVTPVSTDTMPLGSSLAVQPSCDEMRAPPIA